MARTTGAVGALHGLGAIVLAAVPLAMVLANRSSPAVVGLAALLFLAAGLIEDRRAVVAAVASPLRSPLGLCALAFLAWCGLSFAWSPFPALSLRTASEFLPTLLAAYLVARLAPGRLPAGTATLAAGMFGLACLVVVADLASDLALRRLLGGRIAYFVHNRPAMTILLVGITLTGLLLAQGRRWWALAVVGLGLTAILRSVSGAASLGLLAGLAMLAVTRLAPARVALGLAGAGLCLAVALAPIEGEILHRLMPEAAHDRLVQSSSRARVAIARSFGAAVAADPWTGAGFGTSARFADVPAAQGLEPDLRAMLAVGHPHNSFLQVWAELGIVGAALASAVLLLTLRGIAGLPPPDMAVALTLVAAASAIAFVEHGAWQPWWTAGLGAAVVWLRETGTGQAASASTRLRPESLAR
ncbi:polymerase [Methylobacterium sp. Leaf399]|uniref:O-antigen ligase family protein n=1 Tax=Methylobacterium sp. Leaf399 TaxID=1736364 RepID=UPI0006F975AB|nr:O-antigen ligase family protein [Methylobacterium sp. Leaf399]KQT07261.1 polymerase [Methylobacterium sp. Leaf399]